MSEASKMFASMFSGAGGFDMGFHQAGFQCLWTAELNKDSSDVLAKLCAPNLGDVKAINGETVEVPDVIVWGSPCQSFSTANMNRNGLEGESGLFYDGINIVRRLARRGLGFSVWENVPGALSSNGGNDFRCILKAFLECGAVEIGWRILDAKHFGVPQPRRRVFVVADFRGRRAGEILRHAEASSLRASKSENDGMDDPDGEVGGTATARNPVRQARPEQLHWGLKSQRPANECSPGYMIGTMETRAPNRGGGKSSSMIHETLRTHPTKGDLHSNGSILECGMRLRWRTPLESDRLMGWPDDWTRFGASGKEMSDAARYRMTGNGVVLPVALWIAQGVKVAMI